MEFLKNKTILITGGTGSFGQEAVKILLKNSKVKKLIVFSRDENKQYEMSKQYPNEKKLRFFLGDVRELSRLMVAFQGVDYIIHAAAVKHVSASEYNPDECIKTNIDGSQSVISAAIERNVKKVIALSTDKACNPINLYGATKLCAEKLFVNANQYSNKTSFSVVRYGNVIGSRGSVIPYFLGLIKNNEVLPLTSKETTRFFIPTSLAVKFVLKRLNDQLGGELYIPKMYSIKIFDLIKILNSKAKIKIIGIRPGEKINEVLLSNEEIRNTRFYKDYYIVYSDNLNYKKKVGKKLSQNYELSSKNNNLINPEKIKFYLKGQLFNEM